MLIQEFCHGGWGVFHTLNMRRLCITFVPCCFQRWISAKLRTMLQAYSTDIFMRLSFLLRVAGTDIWSPPHAIHSCSHGIQLREQSCEHMAHQKHALYGFTDPCRQFELTTDDLPLESSQLGTPQTALAVRKFVCKPLAQRSCRLLFCTSKHRHQSQANRVSNSSMDGIN